MSNRAGGIGRAACLVAAVIGGVVGGLVADAPRADAKGFAAAAPGYRYAFPKDHGPHPAFQTEWWYYTGHLTAASGRTYGYQLTFFRRGIDADAVRKNPSKWALKNVFLAHSFFGSGPTGNAITVAGVDLIQVNPGGKIYALRSYYSENAFAKQLGFPLEHP